MDACASIVSDMETAIEFEPAATRCRACIGTGMVQCDRCRLADSFCDACGEQAKVLHGDERLPLCRKCGKDGGESPRLKLAPLVASPPTETISALAACIVSAHGLVSPRLCDPDEATVVEVRR